MALRQYVGARYVTKIYENSLDPSSAEWEANVNYEPLTMVTYNNGSYLSKQEVPGNIGDPASNPTYWTQTGFYNGQIASLQSQINAINAYLSGVTVNRRVLLFGDSYILGISGNNNNDIEVEIESLTTWNVTTYGEQGVGYIRTNGDGHKCIDLVNSAIATETEKDRVTDCVLACSVYNDLGMVGQPEFTYNGFYNAIKQCVDALKGAFVNARICLIPALWCNYSYGVDYIKISKWETQVAKNLGLLYSKNAINWLMCYDNMSNDNIHPNAAGYKIIGANIASILNGTEPCLYSTVEDITSASNDNVRICVHDNTFTVITDVTKESDQSFTQLCALGEYARNTINTPINFYEYSDPTVCITGLLMGTYIYLPSDALTVGKTYICRDTLPLVPFNP